MKYHRIKDKILINDIPSLFTDEQCKKIYRRAGLEFIKQSDTVKELCDEFIVITEAYRKVGSYYDCEYEIEKYKTQVKTNNPVVAICGAIWVQLPNGAWRLEPVAKMNEKGDLELL